MWRCEICNTVVDDDIDICWRCGADPDGNHCYPRMKALVGVFKVLAFAILAIGVVIAVIVPITGMGVKGIFFQLLILLYTFIGFIALLTISEVLRILMDIEKNTHITFLRSGKQSNIR